MISNLVFERLEFHRVLEFISKFIYTDYGKEKILNLKPLDNVEDIVSEGEFVSQAKRILLEIGNPPLENLADLRDSLNLSGIEGAILKPQTILEILRLLFMSRMLESFFRTNREIAPMLYERCSNLFVDKVLEHHIEKVIDVTGEIKDGASKLLYEIRSDLKRKNEELQKVIRRLMKDFLSDDLLQEDFVTIRDGRAVVPVKSEYKRQIRGFIHSESATGLTVYIEPEATLELNNDIVSLQFAEKREIEKILRELTQRIGYSKDSLLNSLEVTAFIDSVFARAHYSIKCNGNFPTVNNHFPFYINTGRHPLLINKLGYDKTVPLSFSLEGKNIIVITGPNAGGKTVVLKTVGILTLLVMSGIHVPIDADSNFHLFDNILIDIGDYQSIEEDLSTFTAHLSNIKRIIDFATENSLVLIDEIGTGTEPSAGAAFAAATLLTLAERGTIVFTSTHHSELKSIAATHPKFENASMQFDKVNLQPTYVFQQKIPGSSYALEIAKRIGFDDKLISLAEKHRDKASSKSDELLIQLEEKMVELKNRLAKLEINESRVKALESLYSQKKNEIEKNKKEILRAYKATFESLISSINKKIDAAIIEIKKSSASKESIKSINEIRKEIQTSVSELIDEEEVEIIDKKIAVGDYVMIKESTTAGVVLTINETKKEAEVDVDGIKIKAKLKDLNAVSKKEIKEKIKSTSTTNFDTYTNYRIDIRGKRPHEIENELLKFLDSAVVSGLDRIEILHGKGTGALKATVKEILKSHPHIKNFYFAHVEQGGEGITIAEID